MLVGRITLTVKETATLLGVSRNTAYAAVARGEIPTIRLGRRILVSKAGLGELLRRNSRQGPDIGGGQ